MRRYSKNDVVLVRHPFSDLSSSKVRPAIVVNGRHPSPDLLIVPLTSRTESLFPGEFQLIGWSKAGLNVPTAVKRGIYTIEDSLVIKRIGKLTPADAQQVAQSVRDWLELH